MSGKIAYCNCKAPAKWLYMPGGGRENPFYCDDCVPRGCSCNERSTVAEHYHPPVSFYPNIEEDGVENVDWKWVNEEKTIWASIDEKGRYWPCCEFEYDTEGNNFADLYEDTTD
jgi:hypothetical protein